MSIIKAQIIENSGINIEPLSVKRKWMDNVTNAHAYNCFPISLANGLGWGISFPIDISFIWDGIDTDKESGHIKILSGEGYVDENRLNATLSLNICTRILTDEDITLLTMPVPNLFIDGIIPYTTLMSTSFYPHILPAAVKITKANSIITIPANTPVISILPISTAQINKFEMIIEDHPGVSEEEQQMGENYRKVSAELNKRGEWGHFYRNATNEKNESIGKHEIKTFRLKTVDKRNNGN